MVEASAVSSTCRYRLVVVGGSAGSFQVVSRLLQVLPVGFPIPLVLCLHRLKHVRSGFVEALVQRSAIPVVEPYDKDTLRGGVAYLAPANYHLLVDGGGRVNLSSAPAFNHSRPSIDYTFCTASVAYRDRLVGMVLTGANNDGALGASYIKSHCGYVMVQDPQDSAVGTMPRSVLDAVEADYVADSSGLFAKLMELVL